MATKKQPDGADAADDMTTDSAADTGADQAAVQTVRMVREADTGPTSADVHPDEVDNMAAGGWVKE